MVEWWLSGARKRGTEELLFNGQGVSVWEDKKKVLEMDCGDDCIT